MRPLARFAVSLLIAAALCLCGAGKCMAQKLGQEAAPTTAQSPAQNPAQSAPPAGPALKLTLQDALARARKNSVAFQSALTDSAIARQDRFQAAGALLPSVTYDNQAWYTQGSKSVPGTPIFIANNAVHEYLSQANIHESIGLTDVRTFVALRRWRLQPRPGPRLLRAGWWSPWFRTITQSRQPSKKCFLPKRPRTKATAS